MHEARWRSGSALRSQPIGPRFCPRTGQGKLTLSSLQWVDKLRTKHAWELNTGGPALD